MGIPGRVSATTPTPFILLSTQRPIIANILHMPQHCLYLEFGCSYIARQNEVVVKQQSCGWCSYHRCSLQLHALCRALNPLYESRPHFVAGENCPLHKFPLCCTCSSSPLSCLESLKPVKGTLFWQKGVCRLH